MKVVVRSSPSPDQGQQMSVSSDDERGSVDYRGAAVSTPLLAAWTDEERFALVFKRVRGRDLLRARMRRALGVFGGRRETAP